MNKKQYRAVICAQKQSKKTRKKLINLLINYRSHLYFRYPNNFLSVMRDIKNRTIEWDYDALNCFMNKIESVEYTSPRFGGYWSYKRPNTPMETESDLPF